MMVLSKLWKRSRVRSCQDTLCRKGRNTSHVTGNPENTNGVPLQSIGEMVSSQIHNLDMKHERSILCSTQSSQAENILKNSRATQEASVVTLFPRGVGTPAKQGVPFQRQEPHANAKYRMEATSSTQ